MMNLTSKQLIDFKFIITEMGDISTLRAYFIRLLDTLWILEDDFSGKRPLGNSGWQTTLAYDMIRAGLFDPTAKDRWGDYDYDDHVFDQLIRACINEL